MFMATAALDGCAECVCGFTGELWLKTSTNNTEGIWQFITKPNQGHCTGERQENEASRANKSQLI